MFKVNNRNAKIRYEIFSKLTIKTPEWHQNKFIVNFEHISQIRSRVSIVNFEHVKTSWDKGTRATSMDQREWIVLLSLSEKYLESSQTSIIKSFCENSFIIYVRLVSKYDSVCYWLWTYISFKMFNIGPCMPSYLVLK